MNSQWVLIKYYKRASINNKIYTNKITLGVYELGSVFKTLTLASAFEHDILEPNTMFENLEKKIYCAGNAISEYDEKLPTDLSVELFVSMLSLDSGAAIGVISSVAISVSVSEKLSICSCSSLELLRIIIVPEIKQVTANREKIRTTKTSLICIAIWEHIS